MEMDVRQEEMGSGYQSVVSVSNGHQTIQTPDGEVQIRTKHGNLPIVVDWILGFCSLSTQQRTTELLSHCLFCFKCNVGITAEQPDFWARPWADPRLAPQPPLPIAANTKVNPGHKRRPQRSQLLTIEYISCNARAMLEYYVI